MKKTLFVITILGAGVALGLSACGAHQEPASSEDPNLYEIRSLKYDGQKITWLPVKGADKGYIININNGLDIQLDAGATSYTYDSEGENFPFKMEALVGDKGSESNKKIEFTFTNTGTVENLKVEDGKLVWDPVDNIDGYVLYYNNAQLPNLLKNSEYALKAGKFSAKVKTYKNSTLPRDNNPYFSFWSDSVAGTLLATPEDLKFDSTTCSFKWKAVSGATTYALRLGDDEHEVVGTSFAVDLITADMDVQVKANGDDEKKTFDSPWSESKSYKYIPPIDTLRVEDGVLKWDKPDGAAGYKIKIDGIEQSEVLKKEEYSGFTAGQSKKVQILPIGETDLYYSSWSSQITVNLLRSPSLSFENNVLKWNEIPNAEGYTVRITEPDTGKINTFQTGAQELTYHYDFELSGIYTAEVKANVLSTGTGYYDSKYSNPWTIQRLSQPRLIQVTNQPLETNQVMVQAAAVSNASKYYLYVNDVKLKEATTPAFNLDVSEISDSMDEVKVKLGVRSIGSVNTSSRAAYLDSDIKEIEVTKLAAPRNVAINGKTISWEAVANAEGYIVSIDGQKYEVTTNQYILGDLSAGNHSIYVQAEGNGTSVVTSSHSNVLNIEKLAKPVVNFYKRANGTFYVEWQSISHSTAYNVKVGQNNYDADTSSYEISSNLDKFPEGQGTQISVYAKGNGSNIVDGDASSTVTVLRYKAPTNVQLQTDYITWDTEPVAGVTPNRFTLQFKKDGGNWETWDEVITGNRFAISKLEPGHAYQVQVKANGNIEDNANTIDSDYSSPKSFRILGEITNIQRNGSILSWDPVDHAVGYVVKFSGTTNPVTLDAGINEIDVKDYLTHTGDFTITIYAKGDYVDYADGPANDVAQYVAAIQKPYGPVNEFGDDRLEFKYSVAGSTVTFIMETTDLATEYRLISGGKVVAHNTTGVLSYTPTGTGNVYYFTVQYAGGQFGTGTDTNFYLDSAESSSVPVQFDE